MKISKKIYSLLATMMMSVLVVNGLRAPYALEDEECSDAYRLITPKLAADDILGCKIGLWPYRKSGIRLEVEPVGHKLIVHDYGHGTSGLWLSWGCAEVAVDLMRDELRRLKRQSTKKIAVVGAGVVGLTTAYILLSKGYSVTIYTSDTAWQIPLESIPGLMAGDFPAATGNKPGDHERFDRARALSLAKFQELVASPDPDIKGVLYTDFYCFDIPTKSTKRVGLSTAVDAGKRVTVEFDTGIQRIARVYNDIFVDHAVYLQDLLEKVHAMGAVIKHKTITKLDDLAALPEKVVCNCMGLEAAVVCNDQELVPLKGYAITVKPCDDARYVLYARLAGSSSGDIISYQQVGSQGIIVATLVQGDGKDVVVQEELDSVMNKVRKFFAFPKGKSHFPA